MKSWKAMYSNAAESDLTDIYAYIAYSLLAPENAAGQAERIMQAVDPGVLSRLTSNECSASGRLVAAQPARIHNGQLRVDLPPVPNGQGPFFRQCRRAGKFRVRRRSLGRARPEQDKKKPRRRYIDEVWPGVKP